MERDSMLNVRIPGDVKEAVRRAPEENGGGTLAELLEWWLEHTAGAPASASNECQVRKHLTASDLAPLQLVAVTTERIEAFLHGKEREGLAPQTVNHLRGFLSRAF